MADSSRKTSISPFYNGLSPVRVFKNAARTFVQFRANETLFVRVRGIRLLSDARFGSFLRSKACWRDQISKRISRFVAIVIGVNKNTRESTFVDLFLFSKILENSNIGRLDDCYIARFG